MRYFPGLAFIPLHQNISWWEKASQGEQWRVTNHLQLANPGKSWEIVGNTAPKPAYSGQNFRFGVTRSLRPFVPFCKSVHSVSCVAPFLCSLRSFVAVLYCCLLSVSAMPHAGRLCIGFWNFSAPFRARAGTPLPAVLLSFLFGHHVIQSLVFFPYIREINHLRRLK